MNRSTNRAPALRILSSAAVAGALALVALAGTAGADGPPRHGPPPEAFTACENKASGDACSVQLPDRTVSGTCDAPPGESRLACRPSGPPPGPPHGPPPEAFTACESKASGDACSVQLPDRTVNGACGTFPGESRLLCIPKDLPPPPDR
jgi:hypothetical protein